MDITKPIPVKEKIRGIVYSYTPLRRYDMVTDLGVEWIRFNIPFPWTDKMNGTVCQRWLDVKKDFEEAVAAGLKVMPSTPTILEYPDFCGEKGTEEFNENVRETARFMCRDLGALADSLWQCMNELDIPTFSGDVPLPICARACRAVAEGIMDVNPDALCGTNFASWRPASRAVGDMLFAPGHRFSYVGDDQYYGSWQDGTIEDWNECLDSMWEAYHLPILVNEWGYSSVGATLSERPDPALLPPRWADVCYNKAWYNEVPGGHSEAVQAEYFRRGLEIFAKHPHVLGNFMFCFSDAAHCWHCGQEGCPAECYWGIVDYDCNPKPAYFAAQKAIREYYLDV